MTEFLLSIFYFIIFCFIINKSSFFSDAKIPNFWFTSIFGVKLIISVLLTLIYTKYYTDRSTADIFKYFDDSKIIFDALLTKPLDYIKMLVGLDDDTLYFYENYYQNTHHWIRSTNPNTISDSHIIIRFNALVRLFSFGHFHVHNVFINFISLIGLTAIFKAFKPFLLLKEKTLFYIVFFIPSVLFWGSGLLKESIILFAFGLLLYLIFKTLKKQSLKSYIGILLCIFLIFYTKLYLLVALVIPTFGLILNQQLNLKKTIYGYIISFLSFIVSINLLSIISPNLDFVSEIVKKRKAFSFLISETNASGLNLPELSDGYSILFNIPNALVNTLVRPYFWEANSIFVYISSLENLIFIGCVIIAVYFRKKMTTIQRNILWFNLSFIFGLFSLIGLTTPIFGAIMRYKIPGLILLLISLLLFIDLDKIKSKKTFLKKLL